jgi:hypothetical protein
MIWRNRGSSVSIVCDYVLVGPGDRGSMPGRGKRFFLKSVSPDRLWGPPASCKMGTRGPFPGGKTRLGRDVNHSPPSNTEVVNEYVLYVLSPVSLHKCVMGLLYLLIIRYILSSVMCMSCFTYFKTGINICNTISILRKQNSENWTWRCPSDGRNMFECDISVCQCNNAIA